MYHLFVGRLAIKTPSYCSLLRGYWNARICRRRAFNGSCLRCSCSPCFCFSFPFSPHMALRAMILGARVPRFMMSPWALKLRLLIPDGRLETSNSDSYVQDRTLALLPRFAKLHLTIHLLPISAWVCSIKYSPSELVLEALQLNHSFFNTSHSFLCRTL